MWLLFEFYLSTDIDNIISYGHNRVLGGNIRLRRSHSNSIGNKREKDTAGCCALNRKDIVIEGY